IPAPFLEHLDQLESLRGPSLRPGIFSRSIGDPSNFIERNAACLNLCGQTCPAFGNVGKALFEAWVIGACRPRPTFLRVLATAFSIARHVTPPWAHIPRRTIQSLRGSGIKIVYVRCSNAPAKAIVRDRTIGLEP